MSSQEEMSKTWEKLSRLIGNGVPLLQAIELVAREALDSATKLTLESVAEAIRKGREMSEQLRGTDRPGPEPLSNAFDPDALKKNIEEMVRNTTEAFKEFSKRLKEDVEEEGDTLKKKARSLIVDALKRGSSDLHLIPEESGGRVQFRIDGVLHTIEELDERGYQELLLGFKRLADMNQSEWVGIQTQRLVMDIEGARYVCRLDSAPSVKGETLTTRFFPARMAELRLSDISAGSNLETFQRLLGIPWGIILFTGPFGSGKTTTLYSFVQEILLRGKGKVITIEDPVEFHLKGAVQLQVKESLGLTQRNLFQSAMKQDPDVILLGDILSKDAIDMSVEVALTGHVLLSQMHTADAIQALQQLVDMGKPWWMLRQAMKAVISQRLLRRLCMECREAYAPEKETLAGLQGEGKRAPEMLYRAVGCEACNGNGYKSRIAAYEILQPSAPLWTAISEGASQDKLREVAVSEGMKTLRDSGWEFVLSGDTSLEELERVIPRR